MAGNQKGETPRVPGFSMISMRYLPQNAEKKKEQGTKARSDAVQEKRNCEAHAIRVVMISRATGAIALDMQTTKDR